MRLAPAAACSLAVIALPAPVLAASDQVTLKLGDGTTATIDAARLGVWLTPATAGLGFPVALPFEAPEPVAGLVVSNEAAGWTFPGRKLAVSVRADGRRLLFRFVAKARQELAWPTTGRDPHLDQLILANGGGMCVPAADPAWRRRLAGQEYEASGGLLLPAWGHMTTHWTVSCLLGDALRTTVVLKDAGDKLLPVATHDFRPRDGFPPYEVAFQLDEGANPIAPALAYRRFLQDRRQFVTLAEKFKKTPAAAQLLGATHAYLWGDGRTPAALDAMKGLGLDRMLLVYDQDPENRFKVGAPFIAKAKALGHLVGPYDTYCNVQSPKTADCDDSVFDPWLFDHGGITRWDGKPKAGFAGRGHELCSEVLRGYHRDFVGERLKRAKGLGATTLFNDSDAFGELHDDFGKAHPMTAYRDRENRLARLKRGVDLGLVIGSEAGVGWSLPALHYVHGAHALNLPGLWPLLNRPNFKGTKYDELRPGSFFLETPADADIRRLYDPAIRVPLYQAAFHDAVVSTDRYEFSPVKLKGLVQDRTLLELLYLQPAVWNLDLKTLKAHGPRISALHREFSRLHRVAGDAPLTAFTWLTPDRRVQRARFGDKLELTANFGDTPFGERPVPPKSLAARVLPDGAVTVFTPAPEP